MNLTHSADLNFYGVRIPFTDLSEHEADQVRSAPGGGNMSTAQLAVWHSHIRPGETVIDFGANIGIVSACFAMLGAVVHSVEGSPNNFERLERNLRPFGGVTVHPVAVSDRDLGCTTQFNDCLEHAVQSVRYVAWDNYSMLNPSFVKMDIEGMESVALLKMNTLIRGKRPVWQIEYHESNPYKWDGYPGFVRPEDGGFDFSTFTKNGYDCFNESMQQVDGPSGHAIFFFVPK